MGVTTDDRLLKRAVTQRDLLRVEVLTERLGAAGAMRFMMQYDPGHGDYSQERHEMFAALTLDEVLTAIERANVDKPGA